MSILFATLFVGFVAGWLGQRSRMCFIGGYRDYILVRDTGLIKGTLAFFLAAWTTLAVASLLFPETHLATYPPLTAALLTDSFVWTSLGGGFALGVFTTLSDACPLRHHVMAGQGRVDSMLFILGLAVGAAVYYFILLFASFSPSPA